MSNIIEKNSTYNSDMTQNKIPLKNTVNEEPSINKQATNQCAVVGNQNYSSAASLTNGDYVLAYQGQNESGKYDAVIEIRHPIPYSENYQNDEIFKCLKIENISENPQAGPISVADIKDIGFMVFWVQAGTSVFARAYDYDGNQIKEDIIVTNSGNIAGPLTSSVNSESGNINVAWGENNVVYQQIFDTSFANLYPEGGQAQATSRASVIPNLASWSNTTSLAFEYGATSEGTTCTSNIQVYHGATKINEQQVATNLDCAGRRKTISVEGEKYIWIVYEDWIENINNSKQPGWGLIVRAMEKGENGQLKPGAEYISYPITGPYNLNPIAIATFNNRLVLVSQDTNSHTHIFLQVYDPITGPIYPKPIEISINPIEHIYIPDDYDVGALIQFFEIDGELRVFWSCNRYIYRDDNYPDPNREYDICMAKITYDGYVVVAPTPQPTRSPTSDPTGIPTRVPSGEPTGMPSDEPTGVPTLIPTDKPTGYPTSDPTGIPTPTPTSEPTPTPSGEPTGMPTDMPSTAPSSVPTNLPTPSPTNDNIKIYKGNYPDIVYIYDDICAKGHALLAQTEGVDYYSITVQIYNGKNELIKIYTIDNISTVEQVAPAKLAVSDNHYVISWTSNGNTVKSIHLDLDGNPIGEEIILREGATPCEGETGLGPIASAGFKVNGGFVTSWIEEETNENGESSCALFVQGYDHNNQKIYLSPQKISTIKGFNSRIATQDDTFSVEWISNVGTEEIPDHQAYVIIFNKDGSIHTPQKSISSNLFANGDATSTCATDAAYIDVYVNKDVYGNQQCYAVRLVDGEQKGGIAQLTSGKDNCSPVISTVGNDEIAMALIDSSGFVNVQAICRTGLGPLQVIHSALTGQNCVNNNGQNLAISYANNGNIGIAWTCQNNVCGKEVKLECYLTETEALHANPLGEVNHNIIIDFIAG